MIFPSEYQAILEKLEKFDPVEYGYSRNYIDGGVSRLSPYISRGVISSAFVLKYYLKKGYSLSEIRKFAQELAWRDFWQNTWVNHQDRINLDFRNQQRNVENRGISKSIIEAKTGIEAIDTAIQELYETGYMHNHLRMYVASISTNIARSHWKIPASWMYYHLLDADWASNNLSWQWVAGTNSNKKYFANQENINKYCHTNQTNSFLDNSYDELTKIAIPECLKSNVIPAFSTNLPKQEHFSLHQELPTALYNFYNLDPNWLQDRKMNRVFMIEPSVFEQYPVSEKVLDFAIKLSRNIDEIHVFVGEFEDFAKAYPKTEIHFKEHPLNKNYLGIQHDREWICKSDVHFSSFFKYWRIAERAIKEWELNA